MKDYKRKIEALFSEIETQFDQLLEKCMKHSFGDNVQYIDFVMYPECFTTDFEVYVIPMANYTSSVSTSLDKIFVSNIDFKLSEELDPYDIDEDWRWDVFLQTIRDFFSSSWERNKGSRCSINYYLMTPDDDESWHINERCVVQETDKK